MPRRRNATDVITVRVSRNVARRLSDEARRQRRTRSAVARAMIEDGLGETRNDPVAEARRQSLLVRRRRSEAEVLRLIVDVADLEGWA